MDEDQTQETRKSNLNWAQPLFPIEEVNERQTVEVADQCSEVIEDSSSIGEIDEKESTSNNEESILFGEDEPIVIEDLQESFEHNWEYNDYYKDFNESDIEKEESKHKNEYQNDGVQLLNRNPDFLEWNFHNQDQEATSYTYSTNLESLRLSINTMIKKPVKTPIQSNFKKAVLTVQKDQTQFENFIIQKIGQSSLEPLKIENLLNQEYQKFASKSFISKRRNQWLLDNQLGLFHQTKTAKKLNKYYQKVEAYADYGQFPYLAQNGLHAKKEDKSSIQDSSQKKVVKFLKRTIILKKKSTRGEIIMKPLKSGEPEIAQKLAFISPFQKKTKVFDLQKIQSHRPFQLSGGSIFKQGNQTATLQRQGTHFSINSTNPSKTLQQLSDEKQSTDIQKRQSFQDQLSPASVKRRSNGKHHTAGYNETKDFSKRYSISSFNQQAPNNMNNSKLQNKTQHKSIEMGQREESQAIEMKKGRNNKIVNGDSLIQKFPLIKFDKVQPTIKVTPSFALGQQVDNIFQQHIINLNKNRNLLEQSQIFQQYYAKKILLDQNPLQVQSTRLNTFSKPSVQEQDLTPQQSIYQHNRIASSQSKKESQSALGLLNKRTNEEDINFISNKPLASDKVQQSAQILYSNLQQTSNRSSQLRQNRMFYQHTGTSFPQIKVMDEIINIKDPLKAHPGITQNKNKTSMMAAKFFGSGSQSSIDNN